MSEHMTEQDSLADLVRAYYGPLGWDVDADLDPDDLAECRRAMEPVAHLIAARVAEAKADDRTELAQVIDAHTKVICRVMALADNFAASNIQALHVAGLQLLAALEPTGGES